MWPFKMDFKICVSWLIQVDSNHLDFKQWRQNSESKKALAVAKLLSHLLVKMHWVKIMSFILAISLVLKYMLFLPVLIHPLKLLPVKQIGPSQSAHISWYCKWSGCVIALLILTLKWDSFSWLILEYLHVEVSKLISPRMMDMSCALQIIQITL